MTLEQAEGRAVVATAQLMAALPWVTASVVTMETSTGWSVLVSWERGADTDTMHCVLDGPSPDLVLMNRTHVG